MINPLFLAASTTREEGIKILIVLAIFLLIIFVLIALILELIRAIMRRQGRAMDGAMANLVETGLLKGKKDYREKARYKNRVMLFKQMSIPMILIILGLALHFIYSGVIGHIVNLWDYEIEGFRTITFVHDWKNIPKVNVFGMKIISDWPAVLNRPHFEVKALVSYFVFPFYVVGGVWILIVVQAFVARFIRIEVLISEHYDGDISKKKLYDTSAADAVEEE